MGQSVNDTYEEKGLAYITGRLSFEVAQLLLLEKLSDAKIGAVDDLDIRNRVLKNIEESRLARESSNFGDFARFEREFNERLATKGVTQAERLIPGTPGVVTGGTSNKLGKNIMESMGLKRSTKWTGHQVQHIIPAEMADNPILQK